MKHIEIFSWAIENGYPYDSRTMKILIKRGHLELLNLLWDKSPSSFSSVINVRCSGFLYDCQD